MGWKDSRDFGCRAGYVRARQRNRRKLGRICTLGERRGHYTSRGWNTWFGHQSVDFAYNNQVSVAFPGKMALQVARWLSMKLAYIFRGREVLLHSEMDRLLFKNIPTTTCQSLCGGEKGDTTLSTVPNELKYTSRVWAAK